jgi:hypothetical protein
VTYKSGDFVYYYCDNERQLGRLRAILKNNNGDQYHLRIQKVVYYDGLPGIFKGTSRQGRSLLGEVWLQDEPFQIITTSQISEKATVKFQHQHISEGTLRIHEIIYKYNNRWHIRDAKYSYQHPADYITLRPPPSSSMKVYKLFLDLYYDDFGTYRNVYHSLGGVYLQFGNMPAHQRKLIKNHFVLGFVPFGGDFNEFILPFISDMKKFEQGQLMKVQGQDAWVVAGLGVVTADLPQGNDMVGALRHNAIIGCRTCSIPHKFLTSWQDISEISRYHHITDGQFNEILQENSVSIKRELCTKYGLKSNPSILDELKRERHLQTPQDIYHATAGKIERLFKLTCELFSREGENNFLKAWKSFQRPSKWSRLPNPISHHASFMMSDNLRLAMIMPFLLNQFLNESSLKRNEAVAIQKRIGAIRINLVPKNILSCWVHVAKTMREVFKSEFTAEGYKNLQECLHEELTVLSKV